MNERETRLFTAIAYYTALGVLAYFCVRFLVPWFLPFLLGAGLAALLHPSSLRLAKKLGLRERTASLVLMTGFYLLIVSAVLFFLAILLAQAYELLLKLPELYANNIGPLFDRVETWFYAFAERFFPEAVQLQTLTNAVSDAVSKTAVDGSTFLVTKLASMAAKLPHILLTSLFTVMISLITAAGYDTVSRFLCQVLPERAAGFLRKLQRFLRETLWQYVRAYTVLLAVTFVELALGLWLLDFSYVLPIAATIALVDLLPILGCGTVLVPWGLLLLAGGDLAGGGGLLLLYGVIAIVRSILEPRVVSGQLGLHPVATITAMYAGLQIGGLMGMLAAPMVLLAVLKLGSAEEKEQGR